MRYAKKENDKWIEVQGNAVPHETLLKMGFIELRKTEQQTTENDEIEIQLVDGICQEVIHHHVYQVSFGTDGLNIRTPNKLQISFLRSFFKERETKTKDGDIIIHSWTFENEDKAKIRKLCWNKFRDFCDEYIDNNTSGVSRRDMVMKTIFPDFPLSNDNGGMITDAEWASIKLGIHDMLSNKNTGLRTKVIPKASDTLAEFSGKFPEICRWMMSGVLPDPYNG